MIETLAQATSEDVVQNAIGNIRANTWQDVAIALGLLVLAIIVSRFVAGLVRKALSRQGQSELTALIGARSSKWATVIGGLLLALSSLGFNIDALLGILGLFGFALALAFRGVLENFIAGGLLLIRQPFELGDTVGTGGHIGQVLDFSLRSTTLSTVDAVTVHVPNGLIVTEPLENFTTDGRQRSTVSVNVAYSSNLETVQEILLAAVNSIPGVHPTPIAEVWFTAFGESGVDFGVEFFHDPTQDAREEVVSAVGIAMHGALVAAGIEIPFPQRVNHQAP